MTKPERYTVDLSAYPELVVIYLGMRAEEPHGVATLEALGPQIRAAVEEKPEGLLLHEELIYSQEPLHVGMRQYWGDFDSLEACVSGAGACISGSTPGGGHNTPSERASLSPSGSARWPVVVPSGTAVPECGVGCIGAQLAVREGGGGAV